MADQKLQVIPLGGLGEFGMNMTAIRYGDDIIVVDAGMMFPEAELLGVDLVMPDLTFLKENQAHVRAHLTRPAERGPEEVDPGEVLLLQSLDVLERTLPLTGVHSRGTTTSIAPPAGTVAVTEPLR